MAAEIPLKLETGPNQVHRMQSGDTIAAAFLDTTVVLTSGAQTIADKELTEPKIEKIKTLGGQVAIETLSNTNAVNYVQVKPQVTTGPPVVSAVGADTNIDLVIASKGSGVIKSKRGSATAVDVATVSDTQTFTGKTHTAPIIGAAEWTNAGHAHAGATSGGTLDLGQCVTLNTKVPTTSLPVVDQSDITLISDLYPVGLTGAPLNVAHTTGSPAANPMYFWPFWVPRRTTVTLSDVHVEVTTLSAGGLFRLAIYSNSSATAPAPTTLVSGSGTITTDATGVKTWSPAVSMSGGRMYWLGICADALGAAAVYRTLPESQHFVALGSSPVGSSLFLGIATPSPIIGWTAQGGSFGAFPSSLPSGLYTSILGLTRAAMFRFAAAVVYSA